jgi:hypothetical protein
MKTMRPGEFYEVKDIHGRWLETYELLQYIGPAGTNYGVWLVSTSGLFPETITALLPVQPEEAQ